MFRAQFAVKRARVHVLSIFGMLSLPDAVTERARVQVRFVLAQRRPRSAVLVWTQLRFAYHVVL